MEPSSDDAAEGDGRDGLQVFESAEVERTFDGGEAFEPVLAYGGGET
jgi:hypothetical protein